MFRRDTTHAPTSRNKSKSRNSPSLPSLPNSVDYGGTWSNFFTGGLSLQVEHHLFPNISFGHYPAIAEIVADECAKRGVPYTRYPTLWEALVEYTKFMRDVGRA